MSSAIRSAADILRSSVRTVALTGAGISTPSGIPDFRSPHAGMWRHVDPLEVASIWSFHDRPEAFYRWAAPLARKLASARPNGAHAVLAAMEQEGYLEAIITQNIDSLHQKAGSRRVLELHGHTRTASCFDCRRQTSTETLWAEVLQGRMPPPCAHCGGLLKPDFVLFGEPLDYEVLSEAQHEALLCDVMLIVGTSLEVMPAADLPLLAKRRGARLVLLNLGPTPLDGQADVVVRADVVQGLRELWRVLRS